MQLECIMMQGIPGSGKSTLAAELMIQSDATTKRIYCATDYFYRNGVYTFNRHKLSEYYSKCMMEFAADTALFMASLQQRPGATMFVVVDNVNISHYAIQPYFSWMQQLQRSHPKVSMDFRIVEPNTPWKYDADQCHQKSIHNVTQFTCNEQLMELLRCKNWELQDGKTVDQYERYSLQRKPAHGNPKTA